MRTRISQAHPSAAVVEAELDRLLYQKHCRHLLVHAISTTLIFICATLIAINLWFPILQIYGNSMSPTLQDGDVVLCIKTEEAVRGDVITFYHNNKLLVKRVIGISGDSIDMDSSGTVSVNEQLLTEPYITAPSRGAASTTLPLAVPADSYFVLGDSRATSLDSRSQEIGCISKERVLGRVYFRLWPLHRMGSI